MGMGASCSLVLQYISETMSSGIQCEQAALLLLWSRNGKYTIAPSLLLRFALWRPAETILQIIQKQTVENMFVGKAHGSLPDDWESQEPRYRVPVEAQLHHACTVSERGHLVRHRGHP